MRIELGGGAYVFVEGTGFHSLSKTPLRRATAIDMK
jgi:hypothetical protein